MVKVSVAGKLINGQIFVQNFPKKLTKPQNQFNPVLTKFQTIFNLFKAGSKPV